MSQYMISNSTQRAWETTDAKTLAAAKRAATRECGAGYRDSTLMVGIKHDDGEIEPVAKKANYWGGQWESVNGWEG